MVVVSHLFLFLRKNFRGRFDSCESNLPLFGTIYFPTAPLLRAGDERIELPPKVLETPIIPFDQSPMWNIVYILYNV